MGVSCDGRELHDLRTTEISVAPHGLRYTRRQSGRIGKVQLLVT
jgi:hypothetical protein